MTRIVSTAAELLADGYIAASSGGPDRTADRLFVMLERTSRNVGQRSGRNIEM